jgi:hypothetical protein
MEFSYLIFHQRSSRFYIICNDCNLTVSDGPLSFFLNLFRVSLSKLVFLNEAAYVVKNSVFKCDRVCCQN